MIAYIHASSWDVSLCSACDTLYCVIDIMCVCCYYYCYYHQNDEKKEEEEEEEK